MTTLNIFGRHLKIKCSRFKHYRTAGPLLNLDRYILKNVTKDVMAEGDRSRNLMLFGLKEEKGELLCDKVGQVLLELGEKPKK